MYQSSIIIQDIIAAIHTTSMGNYQDEKQNLAYEGFTFQLDHFSYRSRRANKTPNKKGYFAAFWEKDAAGKNQPFSFTHSPNKLIITIIDQQLKGQFIFPKAELLRQGVLRGQGSKGKMAMRVYPDWETELNKSAAKTQKWQNQFFADLSGVWDGQQLSDLYF